VTIYKNENSDFTRTLSTAAEKTNEVVRRHRFGMNITDQLITVRLQSDGATEECSIYDLGAKVALWKER